MSPCSAAASGSGVDTVVYATGFDLRCRFSPTTLQAEVFDAGGCLRLYRNVLPPAMPQLAFVGFNSAIASPLAAEVAAHWLAAHWGGRMALPSPARDARAHRRRAAHGGWSTGPRCTRALRNACVGLQHHYMDALMREMGRQPKVPGLRAAIRALRPADYAALLAPAKEPLASMQRHGQQIRHEPRRTGEDERR